MGGNASLEKGLKIRKMVIINARMAIINAGAK
jgi:hypothetical protein